MARHQNELSAEQLRRYCDPSVFSFETTADVDPLQGTTGQKRAIEAIDFGLRIRSFGYNIFVSGSSGTGRKTTIKDQVRAIAAQQAPPPDWCYVHNFADPPQPLAIRLAAGQGAQFAQDMADFVELAKREIPRAFEDEAYEARKNEAIKDIQDQKEALSNQLTEEAKQQGFALEVTQLGFATVPLIDGKPISREDFEALPEETKKEIQEKSDALKVEFTQVISKAKKLDKQATEITAQVDHDTVVAAIGPKLDELRQKYADNARILEYLDKVQSDVIENVEDFKSSEKEVATVMGMGKLPKDEPGEKYKVNAFVCNQATEGAPVVFENNPTYYNLFGRVDYRARLGTMVTGFDLIKPGAVHKANHGYLVLQARDVLTNPLSWDALKRTLRNQEARIENIGEQYSVLPTTSLRPEAIPLDLKVILVGSPYIFHLLYSMDEDFRDLFRVRADFTTDMHRDDEHTAQYAAFIASRVREEGLPHFDRAAVAQVVEYGSRLAEDQNKLSANFAQIANVISEAAYWAQRDGSQSVSDRHVKSAIEARISRSNLIEERIGELIEDGVIMIGTEGAVVGQVNGLAVSAYGDYHWGKPSRVTARTAVGRAGIVNIERETQMSGRIHNKGFLTLAGYLTGKYGADKPISLSGSVTFEQMYDEVDGDSASSTELYALLSSLSGLPLKQSLAVTGSVNQHGEVQAIGGVTAKVEGFFDVCKAKGLNGEQGVIIPESNVRNLMLREDVIEAVRAGQFHIYAIQTIDQGIELLTGVKAGARRADGSYEPGSVHYRVDQRLHSFTEELKKLGAQTKESQPSADGAKEPNKAAKRNRRAA